MSIDKRLEFCRKNKCGICYCSSNIKICNLEKMAYYNDDTIADYITCRIKIYRNDVYSKSVLEDVIFLILDEYEENM